MKIVDWLKSLENGVTHITPTEYSHRSVRATCVQLKRDGVGTYITRQQGDDLLITRDDNHVPIRTKLAAMQVDEIVNLGDQNLATVKRAAYDVKKYTDMRYTLRTLNGRILVCRIQ